MPIDYSKYPPNWKTEIRPRILERDDNKCKFCNVSNKAVIFRGFINDKEIYQDSEGRIFDAANSTLLYKDYFAVIEPLSKKKNPKAVKIVLTIAHLDHDETNHNVKDERLASLCQRCHLRYDAPEKARRRKTKKKRFKLIIHNKRNN